MIDYTTPTVPTSLRRPGRPDRFLSGLALAARGYAALTSRERIIEPVPVDRELRLIVAETSLVAEGVRSLELRSATGDDLPSWQPGAHIDLTVPSGRTRQYSLCGNQHDRKSYRIAIRRNTSGDESGVSAEIHDRLPAGTAVTAAGPRNAFPFAYPHLARAGISTVAFVAAGIGITAIAPMVRAAHAAGVDWHLTYLGRSTETMPFLGEINSVDPQRVRVLTGARRSAADVLSHARPGASVYFCGPSGLLADIRTAFDVTGAAGLHFERFTPPPVTGGRQFEVRLAHSGRSVHVGADRSALAAVRGAGIDAAYSCQQGFCGTCRVNVLEGTVERRGQSRFLDAPGTMLLCSDRAQSDHLTLDL